MTPHVADAGVVVERFLPEIDAEALPDVGEVPIGPADEPRDAVANQRFPPPPGLATAQAGPV